MSPLTAALQLASAGCSVLPTHVSSKIPAWSRGVWAATSDADVIERHWSAHPADNVAIRTGADLVAIDLDGAGREHFVELCEHHGADWPATRTVRTPRDGLHLWLRAPDGPALASSAGALGPGIDIRASSGYCLCPPSVIDGRRYELTRDVAPAPCPDWLAELCGTRFRHERRDRTSTPVTTNMWTADRAARAILARGIELVSATGEGRRNDELNRVAYTAGGLVGAGRLDRADVEAALTDAALAAGLGSRETADTIGSGLDSGELAPLYQDQVQ